MRHREEETERAPSRRLRVGVGAATVLLIGAFVVAVLLSGLTGGRSVPSRSASPPVPTGASSSAIPGSGAATPAPGAEQLYVHVSGAVNRPGLIRVAAGARVVDAVEAAGGFTEAADPAGVNLARRVQDGEQLRVPVVGEAPPPVAGAASEAGGGGAAGGLVDLNRATAAQLETLPRIGPALAQRIVEWREANGPFSAVTDLLNVTGLGEKIVDGLKDKATV